MHVAIFCKGRQRPALVKLFLVTAGIWHVGRRAPIPTAASIAEGCIPQASGAGVVPVHDFTSAEDFWYFTLIKASDRPVLTLSCPFTIANGLGPGHRNRIKARETLFERFVELLVKPTSVPSTATRRSLRAVFA
jgi:hypothetical protein